MGKSIRFLFLSFRNIKQRQLGLKNIHNLSLILYLSLLCSIIKVWDRDTLCLQASLHGHFDFITDIDISKCNRFIASAGKDA